MGPVIMSFTYKLILVGFQRLIIVCLKSSGKYFTHIQKENKNNDIQKRKRDEITGTTLTFEFIHLNSIVATIHLLFLSFTKESFSRQDRDYNRATSIMRAYLPPTYFWILILYQKNRRNVQY